MSGGSPGRNNVSPATDVNLAFKPAKTVDVGKNLVWTERLGSLTYGSPVVAGGRVYIATNNGAEHRKQHKGDRGILLCFDESTGKLNWQLTRQKLEAGKANDYPEQGICSSPCVEDDRVYLVTNRAEVMCLDAKGFQDGRNDGVYQTETDKEELDADILWSIDMFTDLKVYPHFLATCSPVIQGDLVFVMTSNGVSENYDGIPSPEAPSILALNKHSGKVVWQNSIPSTASRAPAPYNTILDGQWSSPAVGEIDGRAQVYMAGGDGVLYALDAATGELIWWFDLNPKKSEWKLGGRGTRNGIVATPAFVDRSVVLSVGQDPQNGEGVGHIYRIDATKRGDISPELVDAQGKITANPNSGQIWHYGGNDTDGSITGEKNALLYRRTICTAAIHDGLVLCSDLSGFLHCLDFESGKRYWEYDTFAEVWGSPLIVDGRVLLGDADGELIVVKAGRELDENEVETIRFGSSIYTTPCVANDRLIIAENTRIYAFKIR